MAGASSRVGCKGLCEPYLQVHCIFPWMVRENQIENLDCITCVKLSGLGYYVKMFSLSHRVCFLLTCVLCLSTKSKAPVPNAARNAGTCLAFFSW